MDTWDTEKPLNSGHLGYAINWCILMYTEKPPNSGHLGYVINWLNSGHLGHTIN